MNQILELRPLIITAAVVLLASLANAETSEIQRDAVSVMAGAGSFFPKTGELARGTSVETLESKGPWTRIKTDTMEGFIPTSALAEGKRGGLGLGRAIGSSEASVSSETAGVKGFNQDVEKAHAEKNGVDFGAVDELEKQSVTTEAMLAYLQARGMLEETR